jgi:hypothetical protein
MKHKTEMVKKANEIAKGFFYSDSDCDTAWQPFEDFSESELKTEVRSLTESIYNAMLWVQNET